MTGVHTVGSTGVTAGERPTINRLVIEAPGNPRASALI
jgi:hypothetical protein